MALNRYSVTVQTMRYESFDVLASSWDEADKKTVQAINEGTIWERGEEFKHLGFDADDSDWTVYPRRPYATNN